MGDAKLLVAAPGKGRYEPPAVKRSQFAEASRAIRFRSKRSWQNRKREIEKAKEKAKQDK